jgi:hypothetical protein
MYSKSYTRIGRLLFLAAVVLGAMAPAAGAAGGQGNPPDVLERYAAAHPYGVGLGATPAASDRIVDDWFRDAAPVATPTSDPIVDDYFRDPAPAATPVGDRIVDDYFRDPAPVATQGVDRTEAEIFHSAPVATQGVDRIVDDSFRDPAPVATQRVDRTEAEILHHPAPVATQGVDRIVDDSFRDPPTVTPSQPTGSGFDWGDFGIGAGSMLGLALIAGLGLGAVALRHRGGRLGTS